MGHEATKASGEANHLEVLRLYNLGIKSTKTITAMTGLSRCTVSKHLKRIRGSFDYHAPRSSKPHEEERHTSRIIPAGLRPGQGLGVTGSLPYNVDALPLRLKEDCGTPTMYRQRVKIEVYLDENGVGKPPDADHIPMDRRHEVANMRGATI